MGGMPGSAVRSYAAAGRLRKCAAGTARRPGSAHCGFWKGCLTPSVMFVASTQAKGVLHLHCSAGYERANAMQGWMLGAPELK